MPKNHQIEDDVLYEAFGKKNLYIVWCVQVITYFCWFIYVYGFLGHVCPVTWLGMWMASLVGCAAVTNRRPKFLGTVISFVLSAMLWALSFWVLHGDVEVRNVTIGPFVVLAMTPLLLLYVQVLLVKVPKMGRKIMKWEVITGNIFEGLFSVSVLVAGLVYISVPSIRAGMEIDSDSGWFDTVFYGWDVFNLFLFLVIIGLISSGFALAGWFLGGNKARAKASRTCRLVGFTFLGLLAVGTWFAFVLFGSISSTPGLEKKRIPD
ncbi:MAG: hypothetical protein ACTSUE_27305 [Promethearchaeota archaeon]